MDNSTPWPLWKKVIAYAVLSALAAFSVWYIDRGVMANKASPAPTPPAQNR